VTCAEPSERVIVPSVPVTPLPAVAGPFTGGQYCAHDPLQLDLVAVSGAKEYTVKPLALVSTLVPLIVAVFSTVPEAATGEAAALDELLGAVAELLLLAVEVPQAAAIKATPARAAGANHRLRIAYPYLLNNGLSLPQHVTGRRSVHD
jgi:hypothetical protein